MTEVGTKSQVNSGVYNRSLLDVLRTAYNLNKGSRCTRVVYCGRIQSSKKYSNQQIKTRILKIHQQFIHNYQQRNRNRNANARNHSGDEDEEEHEHESQENEEEDEPDEEADENEHKSMSITAEDATMDMDIDVYAQNEEMQRNKITGALLFMNDSFLYHMIEVPSLNCLQPLFNRLCASKTSDFFQLINNENDNENADGHESKRDESGNGNGDDAEAEDADSDHRLMSSVVIKICCVSEEITREFPIWNSRDIQNGGNNNNDDSTITAKKPKNQKQSEENENSNKKKNDTADNNNKVVAQEEKDARDDEEDEDDCEAEDSDLLSEMLFSCMRSMIEIGRQLSMKKESNASHKLFQSSQREIMSRFPNCDKIAFFMQSKLLFELSHFEQFFFHPTDIKIEAEHVWPIQPVISF